MSKMFRAKYKIHIKYIWKSMRKIDTMSDVWRELGESFSNIHQDIRTPAFFPFCSVVLHKMYFIFGYCSTMPSSCVGMPTRVLAISEEQPAAKRRLLSDVTRSKPTAVKFAEEADSEMKHKRATRNSQPLLLTNSATNVQSKSCPLRHEKDLLIILRLWTKSVRKISSKSIKILTPIIILYGATCS